MTPSGSSKSVRILCFGDSLTAGYSRFGTEHFPYNQFLQKTIEACLPEYKISTEADGESGDRVRGGFFFNRMKKQFPGPSSSTPYDWTIILGGTNDLGLGGHPDKIFGSLKELWKIPLSNGSRVLALTVPEVGARIGELDRKRNELNNLIKGHKEDGFHVYDLHSVVPYFSLSDAERKKYWDDRVHFTRDGYALIGQNVGKEMVSLLKGEGSKDEGSKAEAPARRKRAFRDDEDMFEEEGGDPHSIDKGYIVVRRKDLE